jgi:2-polyprenyl-3-methyl-5-hydroxy-6-metoxy-1,4-benzoquinol methylase
MEKLESCPVCKSLKLTSYIQAKDYTVTGEVFNIDQCGSCGLRFTNPRPEKNEITNYYQSENYISHTDSSQGLINNVYQRVKYITLKQKINLIKKYATQTPVYLLDYGCGTGDFLRAAKDSGIKIQGVESSKEARDRAIFKGLPITDNEDFFKITEKTFDVITLWHVLEHIHDPQRVFTHLCMILKPRGYMFIALPNSNATDAYIYDSFWAAFDVPRHLYHFTPESFNNFIKLFPVELINKKTMPFDPFYISILSEKYKSGNANIISALFNGLTGFISGYREVDKSSSIIYILQRD